MTVRLRVRLPGHLAERLRRYVPACRRSEFVQQLLEQALPPDEDSQTPLYLAALAVEQDERLALEMAEWDVTVGDGVLDPAARRSQP